MSCLTYSKVRESLNKRSALSFFYKSCIAEIENYISSCSEPTREDLLKISVNAKITYDLFRNVKEIQPYARKFLHPLIMNGLAVLITVDEMKEHAALEKMQAIVKNAFSQLAKLNKSELTLPAINTAFIMSELIGFDEQHC